MFRIGGLSTAAGLYSAVLLHLEVLHDMEGLNHSIMTCSWKKADVEAQQLGGYSKSLATGRVEVTRYSTDSV